MLAPVPQRANAGSNHRAPKSYGKEPVSLKYWFEKTANGVKNGNAEEYEQHDL